MNSRASSAYLKKMIHESISYFWLVTPALVIDTNKKYR